MKIHARTKTIDELRGRHYVASLLKGSAKAFDSKIQFLKIFKF